VLTSVKPATLQGNAGLHQKTEALGNASYYVSYTRMVTDGWLVLNGEAFQVTGLSWMDHEWGTTDLGPNGAGWDWFSIQLEDQRDLMYVQLRNRDGSLSPLSSGNLVEADGTVIPFANDQVKLTVLDTWRSESSFARYPARWRLEIPSARLDLTVTPYFEEQEMRVSGFYWEGAVQVEGASDGQAIAGSGYVELTGYPPQLNRTRPATIGARTR
jgi:predicted secreted hydrolase